MGPSKRDDFDWDTNFSSGQRRLFYNVATPSTVPSSTNSRRRHRRRRTGFSLFIFPPSLPPVMPSGRLFPSPPGVHIRWGSRVCKAFLLWLVTAAMAISLSLSFFCHHTFLSFVRCCDPCKYVSPFTQRQGKVARLQASHPIPKKKKTVCRLSRLMSLVTMC